MYLELWLQAANVATLHFGAKQDVVFKYPHSQPIVIMATSSSVDVQGDDPDDGYSVYIDVQYEDLSIDYGFTIPFPAGTASLNTLVS